MTSVLNYDSVASISQTVEDLRTNFLSGKTRAVAYRKAQLKQLYFLFKDNEKAWLEALHNDLGRSDFESYLAEIFGIYNEIIDAINNLDSWAKPQQPFSGLAWLTHTTQIRKEPKGAVLVIGAWNYPIAVSVGPVVGAIAAGNTVVLKPSEVAQHTSALTAKLWAKYMDPETSRVVNGAVAETTALLDQRWEHIFYTGNGTVGRIIAEKAAKSLCPVTLELGGKSAVYVDESSDLSSAAHRILWGKTINCGQTCIAPDYILCSASVQSKLVEQLKKAHKEFYPNGAQASDSYSRIVSDNHWKRLNEISKNSKAKLAIGGATDEATRFIEPSVFTDVSPDDSLMTGEIFGPFLPIVPVASPQAAVDFINARDQPLALYIFSGSRKVTEFILNNTRSGAAVEGDTLIHFTIKTLPFGGTGPSGHGNYHGKASFDCFSHARAVVLAPQTGLLGKIVEIIMKGRYPPYSNFNLAKFKALTSETARFSRPSDPHARISKAPTSLARRLALLAALLALVFGVRSKL
ncbi:unnamed protein product [Tilletia controversa]|uniref:Aldehyde dehydrogenase n=1 Tax=Tilletia caries TaxID=13290 RepID=A0ABN7J7R4_9BASI|nr:hypothetical protein CF336_g4659 [Tilletia laevis]CAD6888870.1 unnamed protein product [Tilletia caries]CAD6918879.1 unnamed protein product [Tilletia controversa]KAE8199985.1 hypothetical protein CF335_g4045 [Tilletia laevis]CAD6929883.1 unnamed protein product [Tilletia caries]